MKERKYKISIWLMAVSIALLLVMQGLWLRAEYRSAVSSFNRETNLLFRTTLFNLSDSLFYSMLSSASGFVDSVPEFMPVAEADTVVSQGRMISIRMNGVRSDSPIVRMAGDSARHTDFRFMFWSYSDQYNEDSLSLFYKTVLTDHDKFTPFIVLKKELTRPSRSDRFQHETSDTIPFTTSFVPFGRWAYAASFEHVVPVLLKRMLPQIGFSVFITLLILLSFALVSRSMRAQQRMIEQKNDFIGNVTHELKTPVATVGVALEAMRSFDVLKDTEKARQYLDMATHELNRLGMMADKILRTSVYDYEHDIRQNKNMVDLKSLVEKVMASFELLAEKHHISMVLSHEGDSSFMGHEEHLTQMVYNIFDNAFKYAGSGQEITVNIIGSKDEVVLKVSDKGPGIAENHIAKIFDKFYRVPSGNIHTVKGYGLGLHYVRGVVLAHGGRIAAESKTGEGTTFKIRLPRTV